MEDKQEKFDKVKNMVIEILNNMKVEYDPHFIFIAQNIGHESKVHLITRACPTFMLEQTVHLFETAVEEQDKDDLIRGLENLN